jgi:hypothetical protein
MFSLYCKIQDYPLLYSKLQVQFLVFSEMSYYFHVNLQTADFCQYRFYCNLLVIVMISASNIFWGLNNSYVNRSRISTEYSVVQNCQCLSCVKAHNIVLVCKQTLVYCRRYCYCDKSVKDKYPTMHCSFSLPSGIICNQCKNPVLLLALK